MGYDFSTWMNNQTFVINRKTKKIIRVFPNSESRQAVTFIDSFPIPDRYDHSTCSRNKLATMGWYPKTKAGNLKLQRDLEQLEKTSLKDCPFCGSQAVIVPQVNYGFKVACSGHNCPVELTSKFALAEETAIQYWNQRK